MKSYPKRFGFKIDLRGAYVFVTSEPICNCCVTDAEVDYQIKMMKENLDSVAKQMKSAIRKMGDLPHYTEVGNA